MTIDLKAPWTFRTIERTIDFAAGKHKVDAEVHAAAVADGVTKEASNGAGNSKAGAPGAADAAQG